MLNAKDMGLERLTSSLYDFCSCTKGQENLAVIFFHSLELDDSADHRDTYLRTWTFEDSPQECWPSKMFREDPEFRDKNIVIRAFATYYDPSKYRTGTAGNMDLFLIAENYVQTVIDKVMRDQPSNQQIPIVLVAHGFGGIVVLELIHQAFKKVKAKSDDRGYAGKFLGSLGGIFFYSTPHGSLKEDVYNQIFPPTGELASPVSLFRQFDSELSRSVDMFPRHLKAILNEYKNNVMIMSRFEGSQTTLGGWTGRIVEEGAARKWRWGDVSYIQESDHFTICKPVTGEDGFTQDRYEHLRTLILNVHFEAIDRTRSK